MRTDNVLSEMCRIVHERVKLYQTDFFDYDLKTLYDERPHKFVWMVRETGTNLLTPENTNRKLWLHCYQVFKRANTWLYLVELEPDGSGQITNSEELCDAFAERMQA